jgi:hypothetical protein
MERNNCATVKKVGRATTFLAGGSKTVNQSLP